MDAPEKFLAGLSEAWWSRDDLGMNLFGVKCRLIHGDGSYVFCDIVGT